MPSLQWLNPPPSFRQDDSTNTIIVQCASNTDLYRRPGKTFDTAHCYTAPVSDDFSVSVQCKANYTDEYQQLGLCLRVAPDEWIKAGVEYYNGLPRVSVVINRADGWSDWSVQRSSELEQSTDRPLFVRMRRTDRTIVIEISFDGNGWDLVRKSYEWDTDQVDVGIMCAAPGQGFEAQFINLEIQGAR